MTEMYSNALLQLAADIPHIGRLSDPDTSAHKVSRICGSELTLDLKLQNGVIADLGMQVKACALGQASASVFGQAAIGAHIEEVLDARDGLIAMLKAGAAPPQGRFMDLAVLLPARDYRQRHGSILLAFEAAVEAIRNMNNNAIDL